MNLAITIQYRDAIQKKNIARYQEPSENTVLE